MSLVGRREDVVASDGGEKIRWGIRSWVDFWVGFKAKMFDVRIGSRWGLRGISL